MQQKRKRILSLFSGLFTCLKWALDNVRFILLIGLILSPIQPHLRWQYEYRSVYGERVIINCEYLSAYGMTGVYFDACPVVRLISVNPWWREWL